MSLINDALKKAQKQRTGEPAPLASMPSIGGEPAAKIAKRAKPVAFNALLIRIGLVTGALIVVLVGGYLALHAKHSTPAPAVVSPAPKPAVTEVAVKPSAPTPKPAGTVPAAPAVTFNLPIAAPAAEEHPPVAATVTPPALPVETKPAAVVSTPPVEVKPVPAAPAAKLGPKEINFIESLRIAGIRASATDSKVLMNDRVYRTGDIVEHDLGLKLIAITSNSLTFEDERGARYTRNF
jgi:hypothetical protein